MMEQRGFSSVEEAVRHIATLPDSLDERDYEALERELECTNPWLLMELDARNTAFATTVASALVLALSRTQAVGSFPPKFRNTRLAIGVAKRMGSSSTLREALPQYYRDALTELLAASRREP
jgi:hypothetical protein